MASRITPNHLFETIGNHLSARDDLWHVVNGPKREIWFNAETIAALSRKNPTSLSSGFRVYGEESCRALSEILNEFGQTAATAETDGWGRIPDVTILENCGNSDPKILTIIEAKLISPTSTRDDPNWAATPDAWDDGDLDDIIPKDNLADEIKSLANTHECGGLLDQLERAQRLFPAAQVFGLVFAVHRNGQCEQAQPNMFFRDLTERINSIFSNSSWCLWKGTVMAFEHLQCLNPLGGMFNGQASIGLGIIEARTAESSVKGPTDGK